MHIERIHEMHLSRSDDAQIGALLDTAFGTDFGSRSYFQQRHHLRLVVRNGSAVIGHMAIDLRAIRMGDRLVQIAGLADVATHPDHRGQGIARALMQAAIMDAKASPADFFVLFGDLPLYADAGFETMPNTLRHTSFLDVRTGQTLQDRHEGLMVMALRDLAWDTDALIDLVGHAF